MIPPIPHLADMSAYALADLTPPQGKRLISLSQNECFRPPSPRAVIAGQLACANAHLYPDPDWTALCAALADVHGLRSILSNDTAQILTGSGSLELIGYLARAYADPRAAILAPAHAYPFFRSAARIANARFDAVPEDGTVVSVDALLDGVRPDTAIVFVANPGNPTGTRVSRAEILRLRAGLRDDILLVIDEAYGEFADHLGETGFDLVKAGNTVVLRTLSKAYGLAGMRVGWGLFPGHIAAQLRKLINPNNISVASQAAARAAVLDQAYMRETCALTATERRRFADRLRVIGFDVADSYTNFLLIPFETPEHAQSADTALRAQGVFLRGQAGVGLGTCLRATIGVADDNDKALDLLERWAKGGRG